MALDADVERSPIPRAPQPLVILLDTHALVWIDRGHPRTRRLVRREQRLYISPANLLELQILLEAGRIRLHGGSVPDVASKPGWLLDDPPAAAWFDRALGVGWTRDPFDRLLVAHAALRGWRRATADAALLARLPESARLAL